MQKVDFIADLHTHSSFSSDSQQSVESMAKTAVSKGISVLGISDHFDYGYYPENMPGNFQCDIEEKEKEISRVKELYKDKLLIQNSIELGIDTFNGNKYNEIVSKYKFDYVIASQHFIRMGNPYPPSYWEDKEPKAEMIKYFENILDSMNCFSDFDIFAHFDYPLRYPNGVVNGQINPEEILEDKDVRSLCDEVLSRLAKEKKALEVNTGGIRSALKRPNPSVKILKRFISFGGEYVTFGSDGHINEHLGYGFEEFKSALSSVGRDYYTMFENRTPKKIKF